jgi:hypothetical protein
MHKEALPMKAKYELTENPAPDAFGKILSPLKAFNEQVVGHATARTFAILLKDEATDEITGGLWGRSLWGSFYIDMLFVPEPLRRTGIGTSMPATGRTGSDPPRMWPYLDGSLRVPGTAVLRKVGFYRFRPT